MPNYQNNLFWIIVIALIFTGCVFDAEAKNLEGTHPDRISCELVFNEHRYTHERTMRTMHAFDLDDAKDIHSFARSCRKNDRDYWNIYLDNTPFFKNVMVEELLEWRRNNGKEEFDDSTAGKVLNFLLK